ncbi:glucose dehydrogenase [FAD, quinone]-like [Stegodyphus dumicola]|uniref:glucose dehydrogenase [FAD, quinone]-like n=1 Tax=Stegodyphus dumicola TaxID=202533 RepID=UPI0015AA0F14|nr:glucose dehydrogenase [FAD, quinone]-like [Stegodyphus dumicola]
MLLLSLMKQRHTPKTATSINSEYDYVIVGAGAAGSVLANRLSEIPCVSVLLLEAGKSPPLLTEIPATERAFWFTDIDRNYRTVPQRNTGNGLNNREILWPSGKTVGGSTVLTDVLYSRGNPKNYDDWAKLGAVGWSYEEVLPYFKKLEDNRDPEYVANGYHGVGGPQTVHSLGISQKSKLLFLKQVVCLDTRQSTQMVQNKQVSMTYRVF